MKSSMTMNSTGVASDDRYRSLPEPHAKRTQRHSAAAAAASVEPRRDGFGGGVNRDANHLMGPRNRVSPEEAEDGRNGDSGQASNRIIEVSEELSTSASPYNTGVLLKVRKDELIGENSAILAGEKLARETDMLLDEQNGNTVEAFTDATTTSVDSKSVSLNEDGGGDLLVVDQVHIDGGYQKEEGGLLDLEILEQVNVSGVEERGDAQDDLGPHDWGFMDGLRKGGLPLLGQGGFEALATTPHKGAGKKGRYRERRDKRLFLCRKLLKPVAYFLGRHRSSINATSIPANLKFFPICFALCSRCHECHDYQRHLDKR